MATGLCSMNQAVMGRPITLSDKPLLMERVGHAVTQAQHHLMTHLTHHMTHGVDFGATAHEIVERAPFERGLKLYAEQFPFMGWTFLDVERQLPSRSRIDLGGYDADGLLAVVDHKFKRQLEGRYLSSTIDEYLSSWQFLQYPWEYGQYKQSPCYRIYLCLIIVAPTPSVKLIPHEVHPETQAMWLASARQKWADREAERQGHRPLTMATTHRNQYGWCPFYRACFDYHLDPGLMSTEYTHVPPYTEETNGQKDVQP
jgi:hypothetical protein